MDNSTFTNKRVLLTNIIEQLNDSLPPITELNTSYKIVNIDTYYDYDKQKTVLFCEINKIKYAKCEICFPRECLDTTKFDEYVRILINDLNSQITGNPITHKYIELNNIKYYPKGD